MRGKRFVLALGLWLILISYPTQWYASGGNATPLALNDTKVLSVLEALATSTYHRRLVLDGEPLRAWQSDLDDGYKVNIIVQYGRHPWRVSAGFSADGLMFEDFQSYNSAAVGLAGGILYPEYMKRIGAAFVFIWFAVGFLGPRLFTKRCPDCPGSFWCPAYLDVKETYAYPGGFDANGDYLSPIVKREFSCPRCGYQYTKYFIAREGRAGKVWRTPMSWRPLVTANREDELQAIMDNWFEEHPKFTRFKTYGEWKAYYDELKVSESERKTPITDVK